jgi:filamentous hemagglutinin family protein
MQTFYRLAAVFTASVLFSGTARPLLAQIQPDNTLGVERSIVTSGIIQGLSSDVINGGAQRGVNLFHSFSDFNVVDGQRVYFGNPVGVVTILTRVTGNQPSFILGKLGVDGGANLFLLNPNGILFGANSSLSIRGSFTATTANSFRFPDGSQFSATQPAAPPLLSINVMPGLQYGAVPAKLTNAGNLEVGSNLTLTAGSVVSTGQLSALNGEITIAAVAGDAQIKQLSAQTAVLSAQTDLNLLESQLRTTRDLTLAAQNAVQIRDSVNAPFIAQAGGKLLLQGNQAIDIFALNHANSGVFSGGDMVLRSPNAIIGDAHYWTGGNFRIEQLNHQLGNLVSPNDPIIRASGDVTLSGYRGASLHIFAGGKVTISGGVTITGAGAVADTIQETVTLSNGKTLNLDGAAAPTLDIRAGTNAFGTPGVTTSSIFFITPAGSLAPANLVLPATGSDIVIGDINVTAANGVVFLTNNYAPNQALPGGNITVNGTNFFGTGRGIRTDSLTGNGGSVTIDARNQLTLNAPINTSTPNLNTNTGKAGSVNLLANNGIAVNGLIDSRSILGNAGNVVISTQDQAILNAPIATASTLGNSGSVMIYGQKGVTTNSTIDTRSGFGSGGNVVLESNNQLLVNAPIITQSILGNSGSVVLDGQNGLTVNGEIDTRSEGGNAGHVTLLSGNRIQVDRSIRTDVKPGSVGNAGNIQVNAPEITIQNGAQLAANTFGSGSGGNIQISARQLTLQNNAQLSALTGDDLRNTPLATTNSGAGGNITLNITDSISLLNQSVITVQTNQLSSGNAGTLSVNANQMNIQDGSFLSGVTLGQGRGGNLRLDLADTLTVTGTNTANTQTGIFLNAFKSGNAGSLEILNARQVTVQAGALIAASADATGQAGNITINTPDGIVRVTGVSNNPRGQTASSLLSETQNSGRAGDILINSRQLLVQDGGQVSAQTIATGQAGSLTVNAAERVEVTGINGRFASRLFFDSAGAGSAGGIRIQTNRLSLTDGGQITVSGTGSGVSGNIDVVAVSIALRNQGTIRATTTLSEGGNILLRLSDPGISIWMQNHSEISAEAAQFANAGNLTLDAAGAIISRSLADNNDIVANAIFGRGGKIDATATLILGFRQFQGQRTPESDFTSRSGNLLFPGEININALDSPTPLPLPQNFSNAPLVEGCAATPGVVSSVRSANRFFDAGRGGLPPNPSEALSSSALWDDTRTKAPVSIATPTSTRAQQSPPDSEALVEATGWIMAADGTVTLVADSDAASLLPSQPHLHCSI